MGWGGCDPPSLWPWTDAFFHDCLYCLRDKLGFCLGLCSILVWLFAQVAAGAQATAPASDSGAAIARDARAVTSRPAPSRVCRAVKAALSTHRSSICRTGTAIRV